MGRKINTQFLFIIISILIIPNLVYSISLGSFIRSNSATIDAGDKTTFEVLFWNLEDDSYYLTISERSIPDGWEVSVEPNDFLLETSEPESPPFDSGRYINLPDIGAIKAKVVKIEIQTSSKTKEGSHDVNLVVSTSSSNEGISISQERDINFKIGVLNSGYAGDSDESVEEETKEQISQLREEADQEIVQEEIYEINDEGVTNKNPLTSKIIGTLSNTLKNNNLIVLFGIIFTILGCVVIYKHA